MTSSELLYFTEFGILFQMKGPLKSAQYVNLYVPSKGVTNNRYCVEKEGVTFWCCHFSATDSSSSSRKRQKEQFNSAHTSSSVGANLIKRYRSRSRVESPFQVQALLVTVTVLGNRKCVTVSYCHSIPWFSV